MILTNDQEAIRHLVRDFANARIAPKVREWEIQGGPPRSLYEEMGSIGLMGMTVDPSYGGSGLGFISYALAMEEISAVDGGISNMMSGNNSPVAAAIAAHGSAEQK